MANRFTQKAQNALNRALICARELGHTYIGSEHLLLGLVGEGDSIAQKLLVSKGCDYNKLYQTVADWAGVGIPSVLSPKDMTPKVKNIIESSAAESIKNGQSYIGTEHLLLALLSETDCMAQRILSASGVSLGELKKDVTTFVESIPSRNSVRELKNRKTSQPTIPGAPVLSLYGKDLTSQASDGKLDPTIGRERETMRVMQILSRRSKNNPCLIGEPGVGKTAVVEGLAQKIADDKVPDNLKNKIIVTLDIAGMIAGAKYRGEFEERMKNIMEEVRKNNNIILFIDEIHTIIGAGAAEGAVDASNIIKPALARGELQIIGATTISEYRRHIEKDAALERRFQSVMVGEPTPDEAIAILYGLRDKYEAHHGLSISDEAIETAVNLSVRYITDRYLPDKAIDLIDESASYRKINAYTTPPSLVEVHERLCSIANEKEEAIISQDFETAAKLRDEELSLQMQFDEDKKHWDNAHSETEITITADDISNTVTQWTGIPVNRPENDEQANLISLAEKLKAKIKGQDDAIERVTDAIKRGRSGLHDPSRPVGVFLFCGRTGVGKTELAVSLANELFGKQNIIRLDMSEYMEKHSVSKLIGSPPGYVGYEEGGRLTEAVRRRPYSVVLFDEIEKAHSDIFNILLQICDDGRLTDSQGRTVNFRNTIIIMTSNIGFTGTDSAKQLGFSDVSGHDNGDMDSKRVMKAVNDIFLPEFINRIDEIIVFKSLTKDVIKQIAENLLNEIAERAAKINVKLSFSPTLIDHLADTGYDVRYGARNLKRVIVTNIETKLSQLLLEREIVPFDEVYVDFNGEEVLASVTNNNKQR